MINTIKNGCLICRQDIKGNPQVGYFCKKCNITYTEENLRLAEVKKPEVKKPVKKAPATLPKAPGIFIGSIKSLKYHEVTCLYVKKIKKENKITLQSIKDTKKLGYVPCVCIKRLS